VTSLSEDGFASLSLSGSVCSLRWFGTFAVTSRCPLPFTGVSRAHTSACAAVEIPLNFFLNLSKSVELN